MSISRDEVRQVARLAHLDLTDEEVLAMARDLDKVLGYVARLKETDTGSATEASPGTGRDRLRPDRVEPGLSAEEAVEPAPVRENGLFKVPPAFGEG